MKIDVPSDAPTDRTSIVNIINETFIGMISIDAISTIDANSECIKHFNTTLASIHNDIENNNAFLSINNSYGYIGLFDYINESNWEWFDGSNVNYYNWADDQPNSYRGNQDCTHFWTNEEGQWGDIECDGSNSYKFYYFVCNHPLRTIYRTNSPTKLPTQMPTGILSIQPTMFPTRMIYFLISVLSFFDRNYNK